MRKDLGRWSNRLLTAATLCLILVSAGCGTGDTGAIGPAAITGYDGRTLRLGFQPDHEALRARCEGQLSLNINAALSDILGRAIRCEYVVVGNAGGTEGRAVRPIAGLSTSERGEIAKDPAVRAVMDLFGGELDDFIREAATIPVLDLKDNEDDEPDAP